MKKNYEILKQIIELYGDYEYEGKPLNLFDFAQWLVLRVNEDREYSEEIIKRTKSEHLYNELYFNKQFSKKARFLETISRIARFHEFYIRKALKDQTVNTRLEFLFLLTVDILEKAKKTDLINIYLVEYTTGMDTIRRLINNGLLLEEQDKVDKRAKLLVLTEKGGNELNNSIKKINEENSMFLMAISDNKWKKILPVLEEIDEFHNSIYQEHNNKPFAEILNLIDSLKHYHR